MSQVINLGDEVKDKVTGLRGIAIARTKWLHGCDRITIQPPVGKDGKITDMVAFDEMSIEVIKPAKVVQDKRLNKTGGIQNDKAALRR